MERGATCYSQGYREDIAAVVKGKREMTEACIKQRFSNFIEQRGWTALFNYFFLMTIYYTFALWSVEDEKE